MALGVDALTPDQFDTLGRLVASGNRSKEAELVHALRYYRRATITKILRADPSLERWRDEFECEALFSTVKWARQYDPARGRFATFVNACVFGDLRSLARQLRPHNGAKIPHIKVDYQNPSYRPCAKSDDLDIGDPDDWRPQWSWDMVEARRKVKRLMGRLTGAERQVVLLLYGIHDQQASKNAYARAAAQAVSPTHIRLVARSMRLSEANVSLLHASAINKMRPEGTPLSMDGVLRLA